MTIPQRLRAAAPAVLTHLAASAAVAFCCAWLVFGLWYPFPYGDMAGGRGLFLLLVGVDVVCGPLLTLIVFDTRKPRGELLRDIGFIVLIQLAALAYGVAAAAQARPVFLAFEGNRFRVVSLPDIETDSLARAPEALRQFGLGGPRLIGVRLARPVDPDFPESIQLSLRGVHPAYRPERWVDYEAQRRDVARAARPLSALRQKHPERQAEIDEALRQAGLAEERIGFLPLVSSRRDDWVTLVDRERGAPVAYVPFDGW
ncbi:MAG: hypothetical protein FJY34_08890 [Betaproteobacteria bacterium]|nr:hypothetical protein [Betaproteobacteria bacterium]